MKQSVVADVFIGKRIPTSKAGTHQVGVPMGLAVFSSDAISSNAYATEAIMTTLATASAVGASAMGLTLPIAIGIGILIAIVVLAYVQTIKHYPKGGGGFIVALDNLGRLPSLTTATALMFDYTLTVAVSVAAGVKAILSVPSLQSLEPYKVWFGVGCIALITLLNLRGLKESGRIFMLPTYSFVAVGLFVAFTGVAQAMTGHLHPVGTTPPVSLPGFSPWMVIWLVMRAFASGCTALTGIEAISDGVKAFRSPKHALMAMVIMAVFALGLFIPLSFLAIRLGVQLNDKESVISQIGRAVVGSGPVYLWLQISTMAILTLAANTAFQDFPRLAYFLARDGFMPRWYMNIGRRLGFDYGILTLAVAATCVYLLFGGEEQHMLPLYAIGVFITFTISQTGMARMWSKVSKLRRVVMERRGDVDVPVEYLDTLVTAKTTLHYEPKWRTWQRLNIVGAIITATVLVVLTVTKWHDGGYTVYIAMAVVVPICFVINWHYRGVAKRLSMETVPEQYIENRPETDAELILVPVGDVQRATVNTLIDAARKGRVEGVYIEVDSEETPRMIDRWNKYVGEQIPLNIVKEDYRDVPGAMANYALSQRDANWGRRKVSVSITRLTTGNPFWMLFWRFLHNNGATQLKNELAQHGITYSVVPYKV